MKGLELPINIIVIVAVSMLVLVVVAAFFAGGAGSGINAINTETAYQSGCARLAQVEKCTKSTDDILLSNYNPTGDPDLKNTGATLTAACRLKFNDRAMSATKCWESCGCSSGSGASAATPPAGGAPESLGDPGAPGKFK